MRLQFFAGCVWIMAASAAFAETPVTGELPPLPPQTKTEQLRQEREALVQEARQIGGGTSIQDSMRLTRGRISLRRSQILRFEEVADELGVTVEELEAMRAQAEATAPKAGGSAGEKATVAVAKQVAKQFLRAAARTVAGAVGFVTDATEAAILAHLQNLTNENFRELVNSNRLSLGDINRLLSGLYRDVGAEGTALRRLEEIARRDREILREITAETERTAGRNANLGRVGDPEYDELVLDIDRMHGEIEQVRFRLRLAQMEGRRVDAELLRQRLAELERQVEALERRADELEELPGASGGLSRGCSAGLFYIPGTETCLVIGGYVTTSFLERPYSPGVGTIRADGSEKLAFSFGDNARRWGGGLSFEYGLGGSGSFFGLPATPNYSFVFGEAEGAWGSADSAGSYTVGSGGIEAVAATLLREDAIFGTGWIASAPGFGLTGAAEMSNSWAVGWLGMGHAFPLSSDAGSATALMVKGGPFVEGIRFDSSGRAELTFDGLPFGGYHQAYELETRDLYLGLKAEAAHVWQPSPPWQLTLSANLSLGYHEARGRIDQETSFGGAVVQQSEDYRRDSLFVGVGIGAGIKWRPLENLSFETTVALDYVPDVTGYRVPENPDQQPGGFSGQDVWRLNISLLKVKAAF